MRVKLYDNRSSLSRDAASHAHDLIRHAIEARGTARIVAATGMSQIDFLSRLVEHRDIDWTKVELFHLDEYVGLSLEHPASFRRYMLERFIRPAGIHTYHLLDGERDPERVSKEVGRSVARAPVDVAFVGIGENAHLAFNDPPADFDTEEPYIIVSLDLACRTQQVGEGWFAQVEDVPQRAISMSVRQILKSRSIIAIVPDARKAAAVKASLEAEVSPLVPASILRMHPDTTLYLDRDSSALLSPATVASAERAGDTI